MRGHHSGGVVLRPSQLDTMLDELLDEEEGSASITQSRSAAGLQNALPTDTSSGTEEVAKRRIRRITGELGISAEGMYPEYSPELRQLNGGDVSKGFTGGVVLMPSGADRLIAELNKRYTGTTTKSQSRRLAGMQP
jgi:hypothetical protein